MSDKKNITLFPELNQLKRSLVELQESYAESKPQLNEAIKALQPKGKAEAVDAFKPFAKSPLTKRTPSRLSKRMKALKGAMEKVDKDLADEKGRNQILSGEYDDDLVEIYAPVLKAAIARIEDLKKELKFISYGTQSIQLQHEYESEISLLALGLNGLFETIDLRPDIQTKSTVLFDFLSDMGNALGGMRDNEEMAEIWNLTSSWIGLYGERKLYADSLAYWLEVGAMKLEPSRNLDSYKTGDVLGQVEMYIGNLDSVSLIRGRLPFGLELTANGKLVVTEPKRLFAGTFQGLELILENDLGFKTEIPLGELIFSSDLEATYSVRPPLILGEAKEGMLLAYPTDPDGKMDGALVAGGDFPPGVGFDTSSGEFSVANPKRLQEGSYTIKVITIDELGGETAHEITLVIESKSTQLSLTFKSLSQGNYTLPLQTGQVLGTVVASSGKVVGMAQTGGKAPRGVKINSSGRIEVSSPKELDQGTYSFELSVSTSTGLVGSIVITLIFAQPK